jgi:8-oxo-dGTP pyrophosphatase MutT (NUDIX family)
MNYVEELRALIGQRPIILNGSVVIIENDAGKILLQERREVRPRWGFPGGLMELGETPAETARREVLEETGLIVENLQLLGVYSTHELSKADNGDVWQNVTTAYHTKEFSGQVTLDEREAVRIDWFYPDEIPENFVEFYQQMIEDYKKVVKNA